MLCDLRVDLTKGATPGTDTELKTLTASLEATLRSIKRANHG